MDHTIAIIMTAGRNALARAATDPMARDIAATYARAVLEQDETHPGALALLAEAEDGRDIFLVDAATTARTLKAVLRLPDFQLRDLQRLYGRLALVLESYIGKDPFAEKLRRDAVALKLAIDARAG